MGQKEAKAGVLPIRQRTQYSCMAASMLMCLKALGHNTNEDEVNKVMGATPMRGAAWEHALATSQHYGCRATLTVPSTVAQLKAWTDQGIPVMIAWNPEGRDWSHASVVFDVDDDGNVWVADPNIPDPDETVRIVPKAEFYKKWYEKFPKYLVRRPAMAVEREITPDGRQVRAKQAVQNVHTDTSAARVASRFSMSKLKDIAWEAAAADFQGKHFRAPIGTAVRKSPVGVDFDSDVILRVFLKHSMGGARETYDVVIDKETGRVRDLVRI